MFAKLFPLVMLASHYEHVHVFLYHFALPGTQLDVFIRAQAHRCQLFAGSPVPICQSQSSAIPSPLPSLWTTLLVFFSYFIWFYFNKYTIRAVCYRLINAALASVYRLCARLAVPNHFLWFSPKEYVHFSHANIVLQILFSPPPL